MMIQVEKEDNDTFKVTVQENGSSSNHTVTVDDDYYEKKLLINFNPWLYIFYNKGLLDGKTKTILFNKGTKILSYVKDLLIKHGKIRINKNLQ